LYQKYKEEGLVVLAFPCNQFGRQEPGTNADIKEFVQRQNAITFSLFNKVDVNGPSAHPIFNFLRARLSIGAVRWNFTKFLVDRKGQPVKRFGSPVNPFMMEEDIITLLQQPREI